MDEDYVFTTTAGEERKLSELFGDKKHLVVHFYMFDDEWDKPCAFCRFAFLSKSQIHLLPHHLLPQSTLLLPPNESSFWLDGWSSQLVHLEKKMSFVAIAKVQTFCCGCS